ncbi:MAG: 6-pyruvoyl trahydropterin synthase family protein [Bacteroidota bacterium]
MMESRIAKEFRWEMGHRLPYHEGGCQNIHGHSYTMRVEVIGEIDPGTGMVIDYFDMKALVDPLIAQLDHSFLLDSSDHILVEFFKQYPMKVNQVDFYSTAENIAQYILRELIPGFSAFPSVKRLTIRLRETENTFAEAEHIYHRSSSN